MPICSAACAETQVWGERYRQAQGWKSPFFPKNAKRAHSAALVDAALVYALEDARVAVTNQPAPTM